ncbi:MAG: LacI family DNA-binding transcriptional regulator [Verrucomicrobia bacterium]|nr:LacI family DNA-binding transcriptional regulator [Verrucomicrobiota bacterium]
MNLVTVKDVASRAGVSHVAVSFVLNNRWKQQRIAPRTCNRILRAAKELNYRPNRAAIGLRLKKSNLIGLAIRTVTHPTQSALNERILKKLDAHKFDVLIEIVSNPSSNELCDLLLHRPEGLITGPLYAQATLDPLVKRMVGDNFPLIGFEGWADTECDLVTYDLEATVEMAIRHLRQQGHERIGYVIGKMLPAIARKYAAMIRGDENHAGGFPGALQVIYGTFENGERLGARIARRKDSPTAYVLQDPCFAAGFLRGVSKRGLRVPEDVAFVLTGYGDFCNYLPVKATMVSPDLDEMAGEIVRLLMDRLGGKFRAGPQRICVQPQLTIGESCGAPRAARGARNSQSALSEISIPP